MVSMLPHTSVQRPVAGFALLVWEDGGLQPLEWHEHLQGTRGEERASSPGSERGQSQCHAEGQKHTSACAGLQV